MNTVIEIQGADFPRRIRAATQPLLVHFYTSWSGQSRVLAPSLEVLAAELEGGLTVARVNLDHCPELAREYGISDVPTLLLLDEGVPIASLDPWLSPRQIKAQLQGLLADYATRSTR